MKRRLILIVLIATVSLVAGCGDQPSLTPTIKATAVQGTETPESTEEAPSPKPTEGRPTWLPVPPEEPTIIQLTDNTEWRNVKPVWSPDGSQILFLSNRECVKRYKDEEWYIKPSCWERDLYLMDADGSNEIILTDVQLIDGQSAAWLRWSPDGERIAFTFSNYPDAPFEKVYAFSLDQAMLRPLGLDDMEVLVDKGEDYLVRSFEWSPEGKKYAYDYSRSLDYPQRDVVIVDEESKEELFRKTTTGDTLCGFGAWSPDGKAILVTCLGFDESHHYEYHIEWVDLNTGEQYLLIPDARDPIWSPDGKWILFFFDKSGQTQPSHLNKLFHIESGEVVTFPYRNLLWNDRSWSPDGKWLAFSEQEYDIYSQWYNISLLDMSWLEMEWDE